MSDSNDDIEATIPWPGFVDILSAVIMVFIFFVMLTIIIISQLSKKQPIPDKKKYTDSTIDIADLESMTVKDMKGIIKDNVEMQKQLEEMHYTQNKNKKSVLQKVIFDTNKFHIIYDDMGIDVTQASKSAIEENFSIIINEDKPATIDVLKGKTVFINAYPPYNLSHTTQQEIALNRSFRVRNQFLGYGIETNYIKIKIIPQSSPAYAKGVCNGDIHFGCVTVKFKP